MDKIEKIRQFVKELQQDFISIQPKDCSLELIKSYAGYAYLDKVLSFLDTLSEEPDKSLEEEVEKHINEALFKWSYDDEDGIEQYVHDSFIAGAEWQASQMPMPEDTVLFQKGVAEGRRLEREDMLKDAVEGEAEKDFGWIFVKDRLPEESGWYFTCVEYAGVAQCVGVTYFDTKEWTDDDDSTELVDYWMPIPELPKEEEQ